MSKFFISSVFTSDNLCPKIQYFGLLSYTNEQLKRWSKISDNRNNVHFSAVIFICNPYVAIKSALPSFGLIMTNEFLTP